MKRVLTLSVLLLGSTSLMWAQGTADWTQWRGAARDGVVAGFTEPATWPQQLTPRWKVDVGLGYATPIVVGNRVYMFSRRGENETMSALDAQTGRELWSISYSAPFTMNSAAARHGAGPKSTPVFANNRLYSIGMTGIVTAWDAATGKQLWQKPGSTLVPMYTSHSFSPVVEGGLVIFHLGGHNKGALTALDANTGEVKWSWTGDGPGYGSPVVADFGGTRQVVTITQGKVVGVNAATGALLWERPLVSGNFTNSITPIVHGQNVIVSNGGPTSAFTVARQGTQWVTTNVWENADIPLRMANGILAGDLLFSLSTRNAGQYFAADAKTGQTLWLSDGRQAGHASIQRAGNVIFSLEDDGELVVVRSSRTGFEPLKKYKVAESDTWTQPVISGNRLFVKDVSSLTLDAELMKTLVTVAAIVAAAPVFAQSAAPPRITVPTVVVTAQKEPADRQTLPLSVTAVTADTLSAAGIGWVSEASLFAPNTVFTEFSARKLSNPRIRGVGSSPANPGITTLIDGVPQLNSNSSSIEFVDVAQVEFVRGPQSALFGRNALGGVINIASNRPSVTRWTGGVSLPGLGNAGMRDVHATVSGPLAQRVAIGATLGRSVRDGFTVNDLTGNTVDDRAATLGKFQLLWTPTDRWEVRGIVSGERARDGDYALNDLAAVRSNPFHVRRDFEGYTERDVMFYTVTTRRESPRLAFSSTTGFVRWSTTDLTDLDYTPLPLLRRQNEEDNKQFTQEVRVASAANAPLRLSDRAALRWQAGVFLFTQDYQQDAVNSFAPGVLSPFVTFPISQHSPQSDLQDVGVGLFGQGTVTLGSTLDLTVGARFDHESKDATLDTFFEPAIAPPTRVATDASYGNVSPQASVAYRWAASRMVYGSVASGFKAGGFNPASPPGSEAYAEESTWNFEGGVKSSWADGRVVFNAAVFHIDWNDLQLNLPNVFVPGQFYIANVGAARSTGVELELTARPTATVDLFGTLGTTRGRFSEGSVTEGVDISDNDLPYTPQMTGSVGVHVSREVVPGWMLYGRGDVQAYGSFKFDETNLAEQDAYAITNLRFGIRCVEPPNTPGMSLFAELWVKNAFDTRYVPLAFKYTGLAPSGFVGEPWRPRTFGVSAGVRF